MKPIAPEYYLGNAQLGTGNFFQTFSKNAFTTPS